MNKLIKFVATLIIVGTLFVLFSSQVSGKLLTGLPKPFAYVSDYANVIDSETEDRINKSLLKEKEDTTNEIAVVSIKTLKGTPIEEYSIALAEEWKPGTKEKDNGVIFLFSVDDRQMRIEVGQGLEDKLTDVKAKHILDDVVRPQFKKGDYSLGTEKAVESIVAIINASDSAAAIQLNATEAPKKANDILVIIAIIIVVVVILAILAAVFDAGSSSSGYSSGSYTSFGSTSGAGWASSSNSSSSSSSSSGSSFGGFSGGSFSGGGSSGSW